VLAISILGLRRGRRSKRKSWRYRLLLELGTAALVAFVRFVDWTSRKKVINPENDLWLSGGPRALYSAFHQGILFDTIQVRDRGLIVMISRSKDGGAAARFAERLGWVPVRGSTGRGGKEALEEMRQRLLEPDAWGGMVCDGPRGPYGIPKIGTILLARSTGLPIVPAAWWSKRQIILKSWDRTLIPLPFGHIFFAFGEPISVPADASREDCERLRRLLGDRIAGLLFRCQLARRASEEYL
jgi:lysophospholipid acyltransferase (LPLAT)-like uncharacterized protein